MAEHSVEHTTESARRRQLTIGYLAGFAVLGTVVASLGPTLLGLAENTGVALSAISFLFTARSLGYLAGALQGGRLFDRVPGNRLMVLVLLGMAATLAAVPLLHTLWILTAIMLILGMAEGGVEVGSNALMLWVHRQNAGPFINGLHFSFGVGAFVAPLVVAASLRLAGNSTWSYWAFALAALPVAVWLARLPSPRARPAARGRPAGRVDYLLVALVAAFFFLYAGMEHSFGGWIYTYATTPNLGRTSTAAYLNSAFWATITIARLLMIPVATRVRPQTILAVALAGCLASIGLFLALSGSVVALWIGTLGLGLSLGPLVPTTLAYVSDRMGVTGLATGWFFVGLGSGAMTIPWLIGQLFESVGAQVLMFVMLADLVLALGLVIGLMAYTGRRLREGDSWAA